MIQPKFAQKQGRMTRKVTWRDRAKQFAHKHPYLLYGGAAAAGILGLGGWYDDRQRNRDFHPDHMPDWRRPGGSGVPPYLTRPTHGPTATHYQRT